MGGIFITRPQCLFRAPLCSWTRNRTNGNSNTKGQALGQGFKQTWRVSNSDAAHGFPSLPSPLWLLCQSVENGNEQLWQSLLEPTAWESRWRGRGQQGQLLTCDRGSVKSWLRPLTYFQGWVTVNWEPFWWNKKNNQSQPRAISPHRDKGKYASQTKCIVSRKKPCLLCVVN